MGTLSCVSIATLNGFILLTATCKPTSIATVVTRTDHSVSTNNSYLVYLNSVRGRLMLSVETSVPHAIVLPVAR